MRTAKRQVKETEQRPRERGGDAAISGLGIENRDRCAKGCMGQQRRPASTEVRVPREKIMLRIKTTGREMKRAFAGHVSKVDTAEKRIFVGETLSGQSSKPERQRSLKKQHRLSQHVGQTQQV